MGRAIVGLAHADWRRGRRSGGGGPSASGAGRRAANSVEREDSPERRTGKAVSIVESVGRLPLNKIIIHQVAEKGGEGGWPHERTGRDGRDEAVHSVWRESKDDRVAPI